MMGFEPTTSDMARRRSGQLSYIPLVDRDPYSANLDSQKGKKSVAPGGLEPPTVTPYEGAALAN